MSGAMVFALTIELGAAVLVTWLTWSAAAGKSGRNDLAGVRTRVTMSSEAAWRTGHRAALRPTLVSGLLVVAWCLASIVVTPLRTPASVLVAAIVLLSGALLSIPTAHRAVRRTASDHRG
ncbi:SdpI family protein [Curtobacterium sp. SP.BCo]|uniref:SdpI family protein n=1 Tax=Curtobacterium sp. SP.BCo TaxID=3435229 RepID=UPI003F7317EF